MMDIVLVTSLKLGVTMTNGLSTSEHVRDITRSCAQTLYALRVLRTHGMCQKALQRSSSSQSQLPSFSMHQAPGADLSKRLIGKELMDFYVEASAVVTARLTFPHLLNNVPLLTNSSLRKSVATVPHASPSPSSTFNCFTKLQPPISNSQSTATAINIVPLQ